MDGIRVLGIDPGLNVTGYGVVEYGNSLNIVDAGVIRGGNSTNPMESRLSALFDGIQEIIDEFTPYEFAIEELYSHYERPKTAILMGHARGAMMLAAGKSQIPVNSYAATKVKKVLTGNGRAPKSQMQRAVQLQFNLKSIPDPPDVADALAIALCHIYETRHTRIAQ